MEERPIQEYYDKAQELAMNTQCLYYYREYVARGMQYQEAVTKQEMIEKACEWLDVHLWDYFISSCEADNCGIDDEKLLEDIRKALEE